MLQIMRNASEAFVQPLRIATAVYPPYVNDCGVFTLVPTKDCPKPGIDHEILGHLLAYAKIPYQLFPHTGDVNWGDLQPDGSFDGLIGDTVSGKYDTIGSTFIFTEPRSNKLDYSYSIYSDTGTYIVSKAVNPEKEWIKLATLIFRVFDIYATIGLGAVVLLLTAMIVFYSVIHGATSSNRGLNKAIIKESFATNEQSLISLLKDNKTHQWLSTKIIFVILGFTTLLVGNLYQGGLLTSILTSQQLEKKLTEENILQKLESKEYRLIDDQNAYNTNYFYENIRQRSEEYYKRYRKIFEFNPVELENNPVMLRDKLLHGYQYVKHVMSTIEAFATIPTYCDVMWVPVEFDGALWRGFIFPKGSFWKPVISNSIIMNQAFIITVYNRYDNRTFTCPQRTQQPIQSLSLLSLISVFLLPVFGGMIGLCFFFFELVKYRRAKHTDKYVLPYPKTTHLKVPSTMIC